MSPGPTPHRLKDDHWRWLAAIVGLPDERRPLVQNMLGQAKFIAELDRRATATPPRATRKRVRQLRKNAEKLFGKFRNLEPDVLMALVYADATDRFEDEGVGPWAPPLMTLLQMFNDDLGKCRSLILRRLDAAIARVPSAPSGNKTSASDWLTREIEALLERDTPHRLTTANKSHDPAIEFMEECLKLAGIKVTAESTVRRRRRGKVPVRK